MAVNSPQLVCAELVIRRMRRPMRRTSISVVGNTNSTIRVSSQSWWNSTPSTKTMVRLSRPSVSSVVDRAPRIRFTSLVKREMSAPVRLLSKNTRSAWTRWPNIADWKEATMPWPTLARMTRRKIGREALHEAQREDRERHEDDERFVSRDQDFVHQFLHHADIAGAARRPFSAIANAATRSAVPVGADMASPEAADQGADGKILGGGHKARFIPRAGGGRERRSAPGRGSCLDPRPDAAVACLAGAGVKSPRLKQGPAKPGPSSGRM